MFRKGWHCCPFLHNVQHIKYSRKKFLTCYNAIFSSGCLLSNIGEFNIFCEKIGIKKSSFCKVFHTQTNSFCFVLLCLPFCNQEQDNFFLYYVRDKGELEESDKHSCYIKLEQFDLKSLLNSHNFDGYIVLPYVVSISQNYSLHQVHGTQKVILGTICY